MATSSIYKSVNIRTSKKCASLVRALESASNRAVKPSSASYHRSCSDMTREEMRKIFGDNDDGVQDR